MDFELTLLFIESLLIKEFTDVVDQTFIDALLKEDIRKARKRAHSWYTRRKEDPDIQLTYALMLYADSDDFMDGDLREATKILEKGLKSLAPGDPYYASFQIARSLILLACEEPCDLVKDEEDLPDPIDLPLHALDLDSLSEKQKVVAGYVLELNGEHGECDQVLHSITTLPHYTTPETYPALTMVMEMCEIDDLLGDCYAKEAQFKHSYMLYAESFYAYADKGLRQKAISILKQGVRHLESEEERLTLLDEFYLYTVEISDWPQVVELLEEKVKILQHLVDESYVSPYDISVSPEEISYYTALLKDYAHQLILLGTFQRGLGYLEDASENFTKALRDGEHDALVGLSLTAINQGDLASALRHSKEVCTKYPRSIDAHVAHIRALLSNYEYTRALDAVEHALSIVGGTERILALRAVVLLRSGDPSAWSEIIKPFLSGSFDPVLAFCTIIADDYFLIKNNTASTFSNTIDNANQDEEAIRYIDFYKVLDKIYKESPDEASSLFIQSDLLLREGHFKEMQSYIDRSKALVDPSCSWKPPELTYTLQHYEDFIEEVIER